MESENAAPPPLPSNLNTDERDLNLLVIFHYVVAGLMALFALFPSIHLAMGLYFLFWADFDHDTKAEAESVQIAGLFFTIFASFCILIGLAIATTIALAGRFLARRRRYTFCMFAAAVACVLMPFGTILGIFTIIVLMRDSVRAQFDANPAVEP